MVDVAYTTNKKIVRFSTCVPINQEMFFGDPELLRRAAAIFRYCRIFYLVLDYHKAFSAYNSVATYLSKNPLLNVVSPAVHLKELCLVFWRGDR